LEEGGKLIIRIWVPIMGWFKKELINLKGILFNFVPKFPLRNGKFLGISQENWTTFKEGIPYFGIKGS